jgi:sialic acid synthase SpsE
MEKLNVNVREIWVYVEVKFQVKVENASEAESRRLRRSLYIVANVKKGDLITKQNLRAIRPGEGCSPKYYEELLGKYYKNDYSLGTPMEISYASE